MEIVLCKLATSLTSPRSHMPEVEGSSPHRPPHFHAGRTANVPGNVPKSTSAGLAELASGLLKVRRGDDVVAVEHAAGLVAGDRHGDSFRDTATDKVAGGGPPEVVAEPTRD